MITKQIGFKRTILSEMHAPPRPKMHLSELPKESQKAVEQHKQSPTMVCRCLGSATGAEIPTNTVFYVPLQQNIFKPWPHRHSMKIHETVALEYRSQFGQDQEWPCGIHTVKS